MKTEEKIKDIIKGEVLFNEPLSKHTSFKIGGPAEILVPELIKAAEPLPS